MTAMTVLGIDDAGEPAPVRPLTAVPDLAVPARRNVPAGPPGSRAARAPGPVRLTRRGRLVVGGLSIIAAVAVAFLLSLTLAGGALASSHGAAGAGYTGMRRVVVEPGQTLWSIASAAAPTADPRLVITQIMTTNSLSGAGIYAGEQLWVPSR